jgi:hypothetical protein
VSLYLNTTEKGRKKAGKGGESDGKKDGNYAFSRSSPRLALNEREKGGKKIE